MPSVKIALGLPVYRSMSAHALAPLLGELAGTSLVTEILLESRPLVAEARNAICRDALELWDRGRVTHVVMLDDDVALPQGGLSMLAAAAETHPAVTGVYYGRDGLPIVYAWPPFRQVTVDAVQHEPGGDPLLRVQGAGLGCCILDLPLLLELAEAMDGCAWFQTPTTVKAGRVEYTGEDIFFCQLLERHGVPLWLHRDVVCGHVKETVLGPVRTAL